MEIKKITEECNDEIFSEYLVGRKGAKLTKIARGFSDVYNKCSTGSGLKLFSKGSMECRLDCVGIFIGNEDKCFFRWNGVNPHEK